MAPSHMLAWQAADGEAQQRTRREAHVLGGARTRGDFAQPCAPWRESSAGGGIFFEVPHSSGLFSRQGTPLFEDTCEACGERSVGGRGGATARRRLCVQSRCVAPSVGTGCVAACSALLCLLSRWRAPQDGTGRFRRLGGATSPCLSLHNIDSRLFARVVATLVSKGYRFSKMENRPQNENGNTHTMCSCSLTPCLLPTYFLFSKI